MTLWEHIKDGNPRYVGILLAELQHIEKLRNKMKWSSISFLTYPLNNKDKYSLKTSLFCKIVNKQNTK